MTNDKYQMTNKSKPMTNLKNIVFDLDLKDLFEFCHLDLGFVWTLDVGSWTLEVGV